MDTEYIARKLYQCKDLVANATSGAQKEIYQGYLEFWQEKAKNIKIHSKKPIKESEIESVIEDLTELQREEEFKYAYPKKKAYYKRNGITRKTKAFKEFLISKQ